MSTDDDYPIDMPDFATLDDAGIEAILGDGTGSHPGLSAFLADVHHATAGPLPAPSAELAALFANGVAVAPTRAAGVARSRRRRLRRAVAGMSIGVKVAWGIGVAAAAAGGAGSTGALPDPLQHRFAQVFDGVLPFEVEDPESESNATEVGLGVTLPPAAAPATTSTTTTTTPAPVAPSPPVVTTAPVVVPPLELPPLPEPPIDPPPVETTAAPLEPVSTTEEPAPEVVLHELACSQHWETGARCEWSPSPHAGPVTYFLLKTGPEGSTTIQIYGEEPTSFIDIHTEPPNSYTYRLEARREDGTVVGQSEPITVTMT